MIRTYDQAVRECMPLVCSLAARYARLGSESFDDLVQEGLIGVLRAVDRYDPARGAAFTTYAWMCARKRISHAAVEKCRTAKGCLWQWRGSRATSLDEAQDEDGTTLHEMLGADASQVDVYADAESAARLAVLVTTLPRKRDRAVLALLLQGAQHSEIAAQLGLTPTRVRQIIPEVVERARRYMENVPAKGATAKPKRPAKPATTRVNAQVPAPAKPEPAKPVKPRRRFHTWSWVCDVDDITRTVHAVARRHGVPSSGLAAGLTSGATVAEGIAALQGAPRAA